MKISKAQKKQNRKAIIRGAVELISEKGFRSATMRGIAKAAGLGEATIYNYFPTKEAILYGFFEDHMAACIDSLKSVADFHTYSLQEQLHTLYDTSLALYLEDREFVSQTFPKVFLGGSRHWVRLKPVRDIFLAAVQDMLAAAAEADEIPEQVFQELIGQFFMDAYLGVVHYWIRDDSDGFTNTSVLIDKGLNLACAMLKAGVANKLFDITVFLFKTHVMSRLDFFVQPLAATGKIKRRFMEAMDET